MTSHLDYEINKELGECYLFMGELDKAEQYYEKAANSNGTHPDPYLGLATVAVQRGHLENALSLYRRASQIEANDKSLAGMALVEMETGAVDAAFTHFSQALDYNPENLVALYGLVQAGHALNRLESILAPLEAFLELNPDKAEIRFTMAGILAKLGQVNKAREQLERSLESDPTYDPARELLMELAQ
ncbi:tetratricopeptide repeat protein [Desulfonatronum thioautotrophicum]|uniref:tetratricopeptide repeat protein n=1 Tax=Desulfonatronum thioautotrophicum TaxID=617001 RepID=UPI0005EAFC37|nr:tetratricopeptide repeat protein [Desulfonatronum thioautotrophicum]